MSVRIVAVAVLCVTFALSAPPKEMSSADKDAAPITGENDVADISDFNPDDFGELGESAGTGRSTTSLIPPSPPSGSRYFRVLHYGHNDASCATPLRMQAEGVFEEVPQPKKKYCFKKAWTNDTWPGSGSVSLQCDDYCIAHSGIAAASLGLDEDRPMVGPCHMTAHASEDCTGTDLMAGKGVNTGLMMNAGCTPDIDQNTGNVTHHTTRCHNCCVSGASSTTMSMLVLLASIAVAMVSQQH